MIERIKTVIGRAQSCRPTVHSITNNVTINDCANIVLAAGGAAIMAQDEREVEEITAHAQALVLNMGAVRAQEAMLRATRVSKTLGHPVVLDPVAAGASRLRGDMCARLLKEGLVSVIRGNASEVRALAAGAEQETGVEASALDGVTEENLQESAAWLASVQPPDRRGRHADRRDGPDYRWKPHRGRARRQRADAAHYRRRLYALCADRRVLRRESRYII